MTTMTPTLAAPVASPTTTLPEGRRAEWSLIVDDKTCLKQTFAWLQDKKLHVQRFENRVGGPVATGREAVNLLNASMLDVYWNKETAKELPGAILFADSATLSQAARELKAAKSPDVAFDDYSSNATRLRFLRHANFGHQFPVMTTALEHLYVPTEKQDGSIWSWFDRFGLAPSNWHALFRIAGESLSPRPQEIVTGMRNAERNALSTVIFSKGSTHCKTFNSAVLMANYVDALRALDPALREANVARGSLTKMRVSQIQSGFARVRIESTCNLKDGSKLWLLEEGSSKAYETRILDIDVVTDQMVAKLRLPRGSAGAFLTSSAAKHSPFYAMAAPFFIPSLGSKGTDWGDRETDEALEGREVPMDVLLAGAPVGD